MLERFTQRAKIYGNSLKADISNKLETTTINQKKESLKKELNKAYTEFGILAYDLLSENMPEELIDAQNTIRDIMEQINACDSQTDEVNRKLEDTKKSLQDLKREILEQEKLEKQAKESRINENQINENQIKGNISKGIVCQYCNGMNDADAVFCVHCGQKVESFNGEDEDILDAEVTEISDKFEEKVDTIEQETSNISEEKIDAKEGSQENVL